MPAYSPPIRDIQFVLYEVLDLRQALSVMPAYAALDRELIDPVLDAAGRFCAEVLAPLNRSGDESGCRFESGEVRTPEGFRQAWRQFCEAGWPTLTCDPQFGGQGLPQVLGMVVQEMLNGANQAWTMYPGLTHGAYDCLHAHGTPEQKALYLPRLVSGEWTGTMCLTEPHCGTDLGLLRTRAEPASDGSYRLSGTKIFISSGEHDLAENIVHLVLARLPDAASGTRGISLFVVPKFLVDAAGVPRERNGIAASRIEHKMGIHGNATCEMRLEGATGWLVGEPHRGLQAMFVMMNAARIGVGLQSLGVAEAAYQNALAYARERRQGRALSGARSPELAADLILAHPDVRRMLLTQKAWIEGGRAFASWLALKSDEMHQHPDALAREQAGELLALLTPVVKAFLTDNGFECANLALQVFGGHGYIREWGAEQFVRDARINMIYEGTNGIQSLDLLGRKVLQDGGARLRLLGRIVASFAQEQHGVAQMAEFIVPMTDLAGEVEALTREIGARAMRDPDEVGAAAVDYLRVIGHLVFAYFWARMARVALDRVDSADPFYAAKLATARFYFARLLPESAMLIVRARAGAASLMSLQAEAF